MPDMVACSSLPLLPSFRSIPIPHSLLHSFFVRIIKQWNALPKELVHEPNFSIFRSKLRNSNTCEISVASLTRRFVSAKRLFTDLWNSQANSLNITPKGLFAIS